MSGLWHMIRDCLNCHRKIEWDSDIAPELVDRFAELNGGYLCHTCMMEASR